MIGALTRRNGSMTVAAGTATALLLGPAMSALPGAMAIAAVNADTVDGFSAFPFSATATARKGHLVATSPTTGLFPANIVPLVPDSTKFAGKTLAQVVAQAQAGLS